MAKSFKKRGNPGKQSFGQKKREYFESMDLMDSGYIDKMSNRNRIQADTDLEYDDPNND